MPSYNHGGFIKKAIESVLEQENVNLEFLITDDGSTDNTVNIINSFSDKRISFLQNKKNEMIFTRIVSTILLYQVVKLLHTYFC